NAEGSNGISIRSPEGLTVRYAHMNIETIDPALTVGAEVKAGQVLGKTGCTWNGWRSQWADPHLHVGFTRETPDGDVRISPYPFLVAAYLRTYDDPVLPVAGGYYFTTVGRPVTLDATRTVLSPEHDVRSFLWRLYDGTEVPGPTVDVVYDRSGQYAEMLEVRTEAGLLVTDFAQVRVYDPARDPGDELAHGWAYYSPLREIHPGTPVTFWNRLLDTQDVMIDYGDGSVSEVIAEKAEHRFGAPGRYIVTLRGQGLAGEPVMAKLGVVVESV
ncbi:MAG: PKD domain-containing protein, partial [Anaerolineae bacterium]